jgi:hypothetical protein
MVGNNDAGNTVVDGDAGVLDAGFAVLVMLRLSGRRVGRRLRVWEVVWCFMELSGIEA